MSEPIRVLLVDAPTLVRRGLTALLSRKRRLRVVGAAATGSEALALARFLQPDVVVVEPTVPEGGTALVAGLCQEMVAGVVLVLTANRDEAVARRLLQAGARGYLDKDCDLDDLVHAIERVRLGELVVGSVGAETVLKALGDESPREPRPEGLTEREIEVLRLVAQGRTNTQIAAELCITEHTVKAHLAKILGKLGLDNRVQLAAYAMQRGLASASSAAPDGSA